MCDHKLSNLDRVYRDLVDRFESIGKGFRAGLAKGTNYSIRGPKQAVPDPAKLLDMSPKPNSLLLVWEI